MLTYVWLVKQSNSIKLFISSEQEIACIEDALERHRLRGQDKSYSISGTLVHFWESTVFEYIHLSL